MIYSDVEKLRKFCAPG